MPLARPVRRGEELKVVYTLVLQHARALFLCRRWAVYIDKRSEVFLNEPDLA